jgi:DNA-binding NtrC family response regulator
VLPSNRPCWNRVVRTRSGYLTDAKTRKHGLMEIADEEIYFVWDNIHALKFKLNYSSALEEKKHYRGWGGTELIKVDVQILASTIAIERDDQNKAPSGKKLYYRLKRLILTIHLSERKNDIRVWNDTLSKIESRLDWNVIDDDPTAMEKLISILGRATFASCGTTRTCQDVFAMVKKSICRNLPGI